MNSYPQDVHPSTPLRQAQGRSGQANKLEFATQWRRLLPWIVGGLGCLLILGGLAWEYISSYKKISVDKGSTNEVKLQNSGENLTGVVERVKSVKAIKLIKVDVEGSIEKAGVVEMPYDSRVQDVLIAAGGLSPKADRSYVSKNINLAQRVSDGMKIYIPAMGEVSTGSQQNSLNSVSISSSDLININHATAADLDKLPGVGPVTASKIISNRPYQEISELINKKAVTRSVFEKIKTLISAF